MSPDPCLISNRINIRVVNYAGVVRCGLMFI
jgi:hypothetical protein